jgi:hypothetical protein
MFFASLDYFIRLVKYRLWNRHADLLRGLEINRHLELGWLLYRQISSQTQPELHGHC